MTQINLTENKYFLFEWQLVAALKWRREESNFMAAYLKVPKIMLISAHNVAQSILSAKRSSPRMRCQNKENSLIFPSTFCTILRWLDCILSVLSQASQAESGAGGSSAAVYFVNGLFQLSSFAARVLTLFSGTGPKGAGSATTPPIDFDSFLDLQARGIEKLWCFDLRQL